MSLPAHKITPMTLRHVHLKLDQQLYERARQAAEADRRSLANWLTVLVERALEDKPSTEIPAGDQ
jgi:hypothetical protein